MIPIPESTHIKHRYMIETETQNYPCDDYIIYMGQGVQCICLLPEYMDVFTIIGPVLAFHDFLPNLTLEEFQKIKERDIKASKAMRETTPRKTDVNCQ